MTSKIKINFRCSK